MEWSEIKLFSEIININHHLAEELITVSFNVWSSDVCVETRTELANRFPSFIIHSPDVL